MNGGSICAKPGRAIGQAPEPSLHIKKATPKVWLFCLERGHPARYSCRQDARAPQDGRLFIVEGCDAGQQLAFQ
jgi:hypothetical protein